MAVCHGHWVSVRLCGLKRWNLPQAAERPDRQIKQTVQRYVKIFKHICVQKLSKTSSCKQPFNQHKVTYRVRSDCIHLH